MKDKKNEKKESVKVAQSLVQKSATAAPVKGKAPPKVEEDDEPRDDFEGFGSITELVKNKDKLIEKTLQDPEFQKE